MLLIANLQPVEDNCHVLSRSSLFHANCSMPFCYVHCVLDFSLYPLITFLMIRSNLQNFYLLPFNIGIETVAYMKFPFYTMLFTLPCYINTERFVLPTVTIETKKMVT